LSQLMVAGIILSAAISAGADFDSFFKEFSEKRSEIRNLQADFTQTVWTPDGTERFTGRIAYAEPQRLMFRYNRPEQYILLHEDRIYEYDVELEQLDVRDTPERSEAEALFLAFENEPERLQELYDISISEPPPNAEDVGNQGRLLVMRPKDGEAEQRLFDRATLHLREDDFLPTRIDIMVDEDTEFYIDLQNLEINTNLQPGDLSFPVPRGVTVIVNQEMALITGESGLKAPAEVPESAPQAGDSPLP